MTVIIRSTFLSVLGFVAIFGCNSNQQLPSLPADEPAFLQPHTYAIKLSAPQKITWPAAMPVKPVVKDFDLNKLPAKPFDSTDFLPFSKPPVTVKFNWNSLPDTVFNYKALPSTPLHFKISVLAQPQLIKGGLHFKSNITNPVYEFGEPFLNNDVYCIFRDKQGFLWIGSQHGVYRYDGENLSFYRITLCVLKKAPNLKLIEENKKALII